MEQEETEKEKQKKEKEEREEEKEKRGGKRTQLEIRGVKEHSLKLFSGSYLHECNPYPHEPLSAASLPFPSATAAAGLVPSALGSGDGNTCLPLHLCGLPSHNGRLYMACHLITPVIPQVEPDFASAASEEEKQAVFRKAVNLKSQGDAL